jgi:hypothetical protein
MLNNLQVKRFLSRVADGYHALLKYVVPAYPTIDLRTATVSAKTADYTVLDSDLTTPKIFTNTGAGGTVIVITLLFATAQFPLVTTAL